MFELKIGSGDFDVHGRSEYKHRRTREPQAKGLDWVIAFIKFLAGGPCGIVLIRMKAARPCFAFFLQFDRRGFK